MQDKLELSGIVLSSTAVGDYDKRLVLLTKERGKITAFARGARKPASPYLGASEPFNFGTFSLLEGYDAYRLAGAQIREYFSDVKQDIEGICYATYFCDVLEYLCVEGMGDVNILNLLYLTLKALARRKTANRLIRRIFELKVLELDGEGMEVFSCAQCREKAVSVFYLPKNGLLCRDCAAKLQGGYPLSKSAVYTLQYILSSPLEKLYAFQVTDVVLTELERVMDCYFAEHVPKKFNSLQILASLS